MTKRCKDCSTRKRCNINLIDPLNYEENLAPHCEYYVRKKWKFWRPK